jgi:hypothetical protein
MVRTRIDKDQFSAGTFWISEKDCAMRDPSPDGVILAQDTFCIMVN